MSQKLSDLEASLKEEGERWNLLMVGMKAGVLIIDTQRRILLFNSAAVALLGDACKVGAAVQDVLPPSDSDDVLKASDNPTYFEAAGPPARLLMASVGVQHAGGAVLVLHDVTEIQRLEQVRQTFVANVSHELRTPLSVILANSEALLEGAWKDPEAAPRFLSATQRHAERLSRLVSDLLDLSRIEAGAMNLESRKFSLLPVVQRALEVVGQSAERRGVSLELRVPQSMEVRADVSALEQVLVNLVDNAVKYGHEGGTVWVAAEPVDGGVRVLVKDDGPGIDPAHFDRLFERFYRVDVGRSRQIGGTGLGLAIVKHLVTEMGGQIGVRRRDLGGIVFSVQLPD